MAWDDVEMLCDYSNDKEKMSSTSLERVDDKGNNVDVNGRHTDGHSDTHNWYDVVRRGNIEGGNVQP